MPAPSDWYRPFDANDVLCFDDGFKDVIKSGGGRVSSLRMEKQILKIKLEPGEVAGVCLIRPQKTKTGTAMLVLRAGGTALALRLRDQLSACKCSKTIVLLRSGKDLYGEDAEARALRIFQGRQRVVCDSGLE